MQTTIIAWLLYASFTMGCNPKTSGMIFYKLFEDMLCAGPMNAETINSEQGGLHLLEVFDCWPSLRG